MRTVCTCDGDPPMCDNKGTEKNKGGRSKEGGAEGGAEGGERGLEGTLHRFT